MRSVLRAVAVAALALVTAQAAQVQTPSPDILSAWNELINNQIVTAPSNVNSNYGTRILAAVHLAQYQAVDQLLRSEGLTWKGATPFKIKYLENALVDAVAAAAQTVLLGIGATPGIYPQAIAAPINALYNAQVGSSPNAAAIAIGRQQGLAVLLYRTNDGTSPNIVNDFGYPAVNGAWRNTSSSGALNPQWATRWIKNDGVGCWLLMRNSG